MKDKHFVFISDFDGTLSKEDFYQMVIDKYIGDRGRQLFKEWREGKHLDKDFLGMIYSSINRDEDEIMEDILRIELDDYAINFIEKVKASGGEFVILSAGTSYYIERLLKAKGIEGIKLYSNAAEYRDRGIHLTIDESSEFYSERYGIDKAKVVAYYKTIYDKVYFAGDSQPDIAPARLADMAFAKSALREMLEKENIEYVPVDTYKEVEEYLIKEGVL